MRTKRLDLKLGQKNLESQLGVCQATILLWEKNKIEPQAVSVAKINNFLGYCLIPKTVTKHFGHQLRLLRINTLGKTIFELATDIGIDEATLRKIEQTNTIHHTHVLNSINRFMEKAGWQTSDNLKAGFIPKRIKCSRPPKFHTPDNLPETLGGHIVLKRNQLKLTQIEVMARIGVVSVSAYRSWELNSVTPQVKYLPKVMEFLEYCPVQYPASEGDRLKLMREYLGLSYREVDNFLELSKGCTYRAESSNNLNPNVVEKLRVFYSSVI